MYAAMYKKQISVHTSFLGMIDEMKYLGTYYSGIPSQGNHTNKMRLPLNPE